MQDLKTIIAKAIVSYYDNMHSIIVKIQYNFLQKKNGIKIINSFVSNYLLKLINFLNYA